MTETDSARQQPDPPPGTAAWLKEMALADRHLIGRAGRYLGSNGGSNDACLNIRRYLEHKWGLDPASPPSGREYRLAARELEGARQPHLAMIFDAIAGTDSELGAAARAWTARYMTRPADGMGPQIDSWLDDGTLTLDEGMRWAGVDGAAYQSGTFGGSLGQPGDPVIVVSNAAGRELAAGFAAHDAAVSWLLDRYRAGHAKPLTTPAVEHLPRVTLEEYLLAWLLHHPGKLAAVDAELPGPPWTADCRHEIYAALRTAAGNDPHARYREVSAELGRRMLRAPGWAAPQVGWPFGNHAQQYLHRLAATPVPATIARHALQAITVDEHDLVRTQHGGPVHHRDTPRTSARNSRTAAPRSPHHDSQRRQMAGYLQELPPALRRPDSVGARVRIQPPQP